MVREFNFPTALVVTGTNFVRARIWARTGDQIHLEGAKFKETKHYGEDADILFIVDGGSGEPEYPAFPIGKQLFDGPSIEFIFVGRCTAELVGDGLKVTVDDGTIDCIRADGLPFDSSEFQEASIFDLVSEVSQADKPPHMPPP